MHDKVIILDFGSQYTQLIARRVRELKIFCEIYPFNKVPELGDDVKAVILSGSPFSVLDEKSPQIAVEEILRTKPVLAVCYGAQYVAHNIGGKVAKSNKREYGRADLHVLKQDPIFNNIPDQSQVWMSHGDSILELSDQFEIIANTKSIDVAAYRSIEHAFNHPFYAFQYHPEVTHSSEGLMMLHNFLIEICEVNADWTSLSFVEESVAGLKEQLGDDKVILGLSGGVDSSVAAGLLHNAIGSNLHCIFVDNGLLRKNEFQDVLEDYKGLGLNVKGVDASELFYKELHGVSDPEKKRKIIGKNFIDVFEAESKKIEGAKWLAQGTIYPDVIESVSVHGPSVTIKSHHNVGGLPEKLDLKIVEPLRMLFKDEVRLVGEAIGVPSYIVQRHPFPGPGLAIRVMGEITKERVKTLQEADHIFITLLKEYDLYHQVWQAGTILLNQKSVGVMGDERTYEDAVALRAVVSKDGMTADWVHLPYEFLAKVSNEIINNVRGVNRVVYDISSKPPATIEWE
ncbi:MAG: GMP synthase (glutamine-hydrolyzing) [Chitinophagales bacterium]|jgi:GMP synthase (glutamine-hydrolysing)